MNKIKTAFLVFILIFISGCTRFIRPVKALPELDSGSNNISILRNYNYFNGGIRFWPTVDGQEVSGLFANEHISFVLSPGKHLIGVCCGMSEDQLEINIQENELRYFKISPDLFGSWFGCAEIEEIPKEEAIERLKKSTRIKTGFMSDCDRKSVLYESKPDYSCFSYILP